MSDLTEVGRWMDTEGHEPDENGDYEWPFPTEYIEYLVSGELRTDILKRVRLGKHRAGRVTLVEEDVSGGYSEYTQENYFTVEVKIDDETVWKSGAHFSALSPEYRAAHSYSGLGELLKWLKEV